MLNLIVLAIPLLVSACTPQPEAPPRDIYAASSPYSQPPPQASGTGGSLPLTLPSPQLGTPPAR